MKKRLRNKISIIITSLFMIIALSMFLFFGGHYSFFVTKKTVPERQAWMTVFVHGTFSSVLGFLSLPKVLNDEISGTTYRNITRAMRKDPFFFQEQPILQRGLVRVIPTFDPLIVGNQKLAAYPLAKAYETISEAVKPGKEKNLFYTFGWTGLISQRSRRYEAIRFYNMLCQELMLLATQGIYPKIRLIGHSHGGNLCLNLAAINKVLASRLSQEQILSSDSDENESLHNMLDVVKSLTSKEQAQRNVDQKRFDYVPVKKNLVIDELILLGTPMQPETELFCYADTFKRVYNFYSEQDLVQKSDWVTSKQPLSGQRFSKNISPAKITATHVIQAKLMVDRPINITSATKKLAENSNKPVTTKEPTIFEELLGGRNIFVRDSQDPTHQELWFFSWRQDQGAPSFFLEPFPVLILIPAITLALKQVADIKDFDVNMKASNRLITIDVLPHDQHTIKNTIIITRDLIKDMQENVKIWQPAPKNPVEYFQVVYKHLL